MSPRKKFAIGVVTVSATASLALAHAAIWCSSWPHSSGDTWQVVLGFDSALLLILAYATAGYIAIEKP